MKNSETKARAGTVASSAGGPAGDVRTALAGFMTDVITKLEKQEERLTMLDRKSLRLRRPALSTAAEFEAPHRKALEAYVRGGDDDALRGLDIEAKALSTAVAADGGYLVDPETAEQIRSQLRSAASIRQIANVVTVESSSFEVIADRGDVGSGWATETDPSAETSTPQMERITIPLHELSALPKVSQRLLDDAAFDIESWLAERIADKFSRSEAAAFINGDGIDKPVGFLTHPQVDNDDWSWGSLGYIATGSDGGFASSAGADALVDLVYALGARYRANGSFVMNSKTAGEVRKMKDADGRFLWADSLAAGEPARLLGYRVLVAEDMPDIASEASAIAFGDFEAGYTVAERPDLRILRDPFSAKPNVLFYATKRVGGDVSDYAAIKLLKFATT